MFKNLKPNWENQREIWDSTLTLWHESWTSCVWRMLVLVWIVFLHVRSIRESSHWGFWLYLRFPQSIFSCLLKRKWADREGHSWSRLWDMWIPLKLFIDGPWTETCFPISPHDGEVTADSVVVEIPFIDECKGVFQDRIAQVTILRAYWLVNYSGYFFCGIPTVLLKAVSWLDN